jgi:hypothetical protein
MVKFKVGVWRVRTLPTWLFVVVSEVEDPSIHELVDHVEALGEVQIEMDPDVLKTRKKADEAIDAEKMVE